MTQQIGPASIELADDEDPIMAVWGTMVPKIGPAASVFSQAVYEHSTLGLREFEAARLKVAQVNGCLMCLGWRTERDGHKVEESFLESVENWDTTDAFDARTALAAEYAQRYCEDHQGLDADFWERMKAQYSAAEIVELSMCIGSWLAFGRLNHVLGIDAVCTIDPG